MGLFSTFLGLPKKEKPFDEEKYNAENKAAIEKWHQKYDMETVAGIESIPVPTVKAEYGEAPVPTLLEQVLMKAATQHKKNGRMDLAIACLRKANDIMPFSGCGYNRSSYERLVEYLKLDRQFDAARAEHERLDSLYGTELDGLNFAMKAFCKPGKEQQEYYKTIIVPFLEEQKDRADYDWLCEFNPEDAPKSFSAYRRMKNMNSEKYKALAALLKNK